MMRRVRIFVSSPGDVGHERRRVDRVVERLNGEFAGVAQLETIRWETEFYRADATFQTQIPAASDCDIVVAIFRARLGTELPPDFERLPDGSPYPSGTAYEVLSAIAARQQGDLPDVYVFRYPEPPTVRLDDPEAARVEEQWQRLKAFFDTWFVAAEGPFKAAFHTYGSTDDLEDQLDRLLRGWLEDRVLHGRAVLWPIATKGSPFRGLAAFGAKHAPVFFGRSRDIARAIDRWKDAAEHGTPFLLVVGASGSGKSSLAQAGLVPRLTVPGVVPAVDLWRVAAMRPSEISPGPVATLAARLLDSDKDISEAEGGRLPALPELAESDYRTPAELAALLAHADASSLVPLLRVLDRIGEAARARQGYDRAVRVDLVLLIDQLDELFGAAVSAEERGRFVRLLRLSAESGRVWLVVTLRADLYEKFLAEPDLLALKTQGAAYDLAPPGAAELAEIVRKPAEAAELHFEKDPATGQGLDERLLREADRPDMLPLLQLALDRLFEGRLVAQGETRLTFAAYEALGGLSGIIDREAERALASLGEAEQARLPRLLRRFVTDASTAGGLTVRTVPFVEAAPDAPSRRLIDALVAGRILMTSGEGAATGVQLAHQRVLADWRRARELVAADRDFYRVRDEVEAQRRRWYNAGESRDLLIPRGLPLAEAEAIAARFGDELAPESRSFIAISGRRARLRQRLVAAAALVFALLTVGATGAGLVAWRERQEAVRQQALAERNLAAAENAVNSLIFDISQGLRDQGVRIESVRKVLGVVRTTVENLSRDAPDDVALLGSRGEMLNEFAQTYLALGDLASARQSAEAAVAVFTGLAARFPDEPSWQNNLVVGLTRLGDAASRAGDAAAALDATERALTRIDAMLAQHPNDPRWQQSRSIGLERLGDLRVRAGDTAGALAAFSDGLAVRRRLADDDPANPEWRRGLSAFTDRIGDLRLRSGDRTAALSSYEEGLAALRQLVKDDANDTRSQRNLAVTLNKIGDLRLGNGEVPAALDAFHEATAVTRRLVEIDGANVEWRRDLAICLSKVGRAEVRAGDTALAYPAYDEGLKLRRQLSKLDPDNLQSQRDLAVALIDLANLKVLIQRAVPRGPGEGGRPEPAVENAKSAVALYNEALAISRRLAAIDPDNVELQRDISVAASGLGDAANASDDPASALAAYREALSVIERLTGAEPTNVQWQTDQAILIVKIAMIDDPALRKAGLQRALAILAPLQRDGKLAGSFAGLPDELRKLIAASPE